MATKIETIAKAAAAAEATRNALREALTIASSTEALVLLPLIERATLLERDARALAGAMTLDRND